MLKKWVWIVGICCWGGAALGGGLQEQVLAQKLQPPPQEILQRLQAVADRPVPPQIAARLTPFLRQTQQKARQYVVIYDEPDLRLEDFDSRIGNHTYRRKRMYRWVSDECHYSSYVTAQALTQAMAADRNALVFSHLYMLTAYPQNGEFLTPASGPRFKLANGQEGLHWRYHTAVLIILEQNHQYFPVVLDSFLGGLRPLSVSEWQEHFAPDTRFTTTLFQRSKKTENALKIPQRLDGSAVWVDGKKYLPAPVLQ